MEGCPFDYIFERIVKEVPLKDRWILIDDIKTAAENRLRTFNRRKKEAEDMKLAKAVL